MLLSLPCVVQCMCACAYDGFERSACAYDGFERSAMPTTGCFYDLQCTPVKLGLQVLHFEFLNTFRPKQKITFELTACFCSGFPNVRLLFCPVVEKHSEC